MISQICYAVVYLIEAIISVFYFGKKFMPKRKLSFILSAALLGGGASFVLSLMETPALNILCFFAVNLLILLLCYETNIKSGLFHSFLLSAFMVATELIVLVSFAVLFSLDVTACENDPYLLVIVATISKTLYFTVVYFTAKFSLKEFKSDKPFSSLLLCVLPVASISFMHASVLISIEYNLSEAVKSALMLCNLFSLSANIVVFHVYDKTIATNRKYTELLLTKQKEDNSVSYYRLLDEQNEKARVLIHDITNHLNSIKMLSASKNPEIVSYIDAIQSDFDIRNPVSCCDNALLNLIVNRYYKICRDDNIRFDINLKNAAVDFMSEPDITALFDNLLSNAVEAARQSKDGFIDFSIEIKIKGFLVIRLLNSCDKEPIKKGRVFVTTKSNSEAHGIGTKSIGRVVKKYGGSCSFDYNQNERVFSTLITFQLPRRSTSAGFTLYKFF